MPLNALLINGIATLVTFVNSKKTTIYIKNKALNKISRFSARYSSVSEMLQYHTRAFIIHAFTSFISRANTFNTVITTQDVHKNMFISAKTFKKMRTV